MMSGAVVEDRIAELDRKLDFILEELAHLRRIRNSAEDLVADLTIVGKDAIGDAVEALGSTTLRPQELFQLVKTVSQDAKLLTGTLQQLESAADFVQDAQPIVRDLFRQAVASCQMMQEKGYFEAAAAGMRIGDSLIQSHSLNDWKQVEASVPQLVGFLRELTHPDVLQALEAIIHGFGTVQATMNVNKSVFEILRDLNSSNARRGISILVEFLKVVGSCSVTAGLAGTPAAATPER
jgi:uncharacterized protein YjgD (DUF1641 family)